MERRWVWVFTAVAGAVVVDDQFTKAFAARRGLVAGNPSLAFGVVGGPARLLIVGTIAVLVAFLAVVMPKAVARGVSPVIPALIAGGMSANLLDRIRLGVARDFLPTPWVTINVADVAVATGVVALVFASTRRMVKARYEMAARAERR